jgi:hypothetical protein
MVKKSLIKEATIMPVPTEKMPEIIEVSYTEAKKLTKRPVSEKQRIQGAKLVELNRIRWEANKKAKEEEQKKKEEEMMKTHTKVYVKPKRVYPPRTKQLPKEEIKPELETIESESENESDSDEVQYRKPPPPTPKIKIKHVEHKVNKIEELNNKIKAIKQQQAPPSNDYAAMLNRFWKLS